MYLFGINLKVAYFSITNFLYIFSSPKGILRSSYTYRVLFNEVFRAEAEKKENVISVAGKSGKVRKDA